MTYLTVVRAVVLELLGAAIVVSSRTQHQEQQY